MMSSRRHRTVRGNEHGPVPLTHKNLESHGLAFDLKRPTELEYAQACAIQQQAVVAMHRPLALYSDQITAASTPTAAAADEAAARALLEDLIQYQEEPSDHWPCARFAQLSYQQHNSPAPAFIERSAAYCAGAVDSPSFSYREHSYTAMDDEICAADFDKDGQSAMVKVAARTHEITAQDMLAAKVKRHNEERLERLYHSKM